MNWHEKRSEGLSVVASQGDQLEPAHSVAFKRFEIGVKDPDAGPGFSVGGDELLVPLRCLVGIVGLVRLKNNFEGNVKGPVVDLAVVVSQPADCKRDAAGMTGEMLAAGGDKPRNSLSRAVLQREVDSMREHGEIFPSEGKRR